MGALTSSPISFTYRIWEFGTQTTYDLTDNISPQIRVDIRHNAVARILPLFKWISNKIRFFRPRMVLLLPLIGFNITQRFYLSNAGDRNNYARSSVHYLRTFFINKPFIYLCSILFLKLFDSHKKTCNFFLGDIYSPSFKRFSLLENNNNFFKQKIIQNISLPRVDFNNNNYNFSEFENLILFAVNPRLETPQLDLELREAFLEKEIFSLGDHSFSFSIQTIFAGNKNIIDFLNQSFLNKETLLVFSMTTLHLAEKLTNFSNRLFLLPLTFINQTQSVFLSNNFYNKRNSSINIIVDAAPSVENNSTNYMDVFFTNYVPYKKNNFIFFPLTQYFYTRFPFYNLKKESKIFPAIFPTYSTQDCLDAFFLSLLFSYSLFRSSATIVKYSFNEPRSFFSFIETNESASFLLVNLSLFFFEDLV